MQGIGGLNKLDNVITLEAYLILKGRNTVGSYSSTFSRYQGRNIGFHPW